MIVIGLVGEKRGGKGSFTEILRTLLPHANILRVGSGDIVGDLLDLLGKPRTRENMQELPVILIKGYRQPDVITQAMKKRLKELGHANPDIVILDSIRTQADAAMLKEFPKHLLVYVTAKQEIRWKRALKANEKVGEGRISFEEFKKQDEAEIERMIPVIGSTADYVIINERSLDEYRDEVLQICRLYIQPEE